MVLRGISASHGVALGAVYIYRPSDIDAAERFIKSDAVEREKDHYAEVCEIAAGEIRSIHASMAHDKPEKAKIFSTHLDILYDPDIRNEIIEGIEAELWAGSWAIWKAYGKFIEVIEKTKDPVIRERSVDLEDVRKRILRIWHRLPGSNLTSLSAPVIIAARDLLPSDTATLDRRNALAIITETGGASSHSAIIARSYGIPAVVGIPRLLESLRQNGFAAVDALTGEVFPDPDNETQKRLAAKRARYLREAAEIKKFSKRKSATADGMRIDIGLNIGCADDDDLAGATCTDFVGLFRTEFLFMGRKDLPSEDEQFAAYRKVLELYGKRPVTLRTLDIGGDKQLDCMETPKEDNPFLGNRALRLCFAYPGIFKTQLRAALRASVFGNLHLMLPMVGSIDDIRRAKSIIQEVEDDLDCDGIAYNRDFRLGIMIEIPSIAMIADLAAEEVDFASIGTNDLCQYLTAVDRMNPEVSCYYQSFHPAVFRLIGKVAGHFNSAGKPLCVCGEMGGDPFAAAALVGLGLRKLSMGLSSVAQVKRMISRLPIMAFEEIARTVQELSTADEVENFLKQILG